MVTSVLAVARGDTEAIRIKKECQVKEGPRAVMTCMCQRPIH